MKSQIKPTVTLMTLDPGHFHAALVQKRMYPQINDTVYVYAPDGPEVKSHLALVDSFNNADKKPTTWKEEVYIGSDYLHQMLSKKPGNVVVLAGNNQKKVHYIRACAKKGINILADKPMCTNMNDFKILLNAYDIAAEKKSLIYDIMTERSEITTIVQKTLVHDKNVFGSFIKGSVNDPAVVKESVHHFYKHVAGKPLKRPTWYFDTDIQGEGIVDVTTHLADLVMWECFPEQLINYNSDIRILQAKRWPTLIDSSMYKKVTGADSWPKTLADDLNDKGQLPCYANGSIIYDIKGIVAKIAVTWNYQAPAGGGDTHFSVMKGTNAHVSIEQGPQHNFKPQVFVIPAPGTNAKKLAAALKKSLAQLSTKYPGLTCKQQDGKWQILIPDELRIGHEAHFAQVMQRYLGYLEKTQIPAWEKSYILAKYYTTAKALEIAKRK
jgi:predicted dehydrogenase